MIGEQENNTMNAATLASVTTTLVFIQAQLAEIKADVKALNNIFANKEELTTISRELSKRLTTLERSSNLWKFLTPTFSAFVAALMTFFVVQYFQHYH